MAANNINIANTASTVAVNAGRQVTDAANRVHQGAGQAFAGNQQGFQSAPSFNDVLNRQINSRQLQFSKHASARLNERQIELTRDQLTRVEDGVTQARGKGINDSLVLVDDVALVVNTRNNIVITAMSKQAENIFTNIDGAVVV